MTKEEIIAQLRLVDKETLEKVFNYTRLSFVPNPATLSKVTSFQLVEEAHAVADVVFPEWTDRSKSDFGQFLVETFAAFGEKAIWYLNYYASLSNIQNTQSYYSAFLKALYSGYFPKLYVPSVLSIEISYTNTQTASAAATEIQAIVENTALNSFEPVLFPATAIPNTAVIKVGAVQYTSFSISYAGKEIFLPDIDIYLASIEVFVNAQKYLVTFDKVESSTENYCLVYPREDDGAILLFSESVGAVPEIGDSVNVRYVFGGRELYTASAASAIEFSNLPETLTVLSASVVSNIPFSPADTLASLQRNLRNNVLLRGGINNKQSAEAYLRNESSVKESYAEFVYSIIIFRVVREGGAETSTEFLTQLTNKLSPFLSQGFSLIGTSNVFVPVSDLVLTASFAEGTQNIDEIAARLHYAIYEYLNPYLLGTYGRGIRFNELFSVCVSLYRNLINLSVSSIDSVPLATQFLINPSELLTPLYTNSDVPTTLLTANTAQYVRGVFTMNVNIV